MSLRPHHPGTVEIMTAFSGEVENIPHDSLPPEQQFVMLTRHGIETNDVSQAEKFVPVVKIKIFSHDENGRLVDPQDAKSIRILEYDKDNKLIRSTTMRR
ncbi:hypothetical protein [Jiella mangrovi]|uniref:Uncharacterized protein n=1 Tax=Jiella mangrovi TaxID=2821407 RepID=A0ABS4BME3_9HYPH|nr:hypothetical protein [Jiella mangrovi]MBP0617330.1 hypothetical protein [Jiella mangrovi]